MSEYALNLTGVHKSFARKSVLRGVDLSLPAGTIMGLMGKNGAGKSTLIKCVLGLLKPDSGASTVFGRDSWNLDEAAKHRIGYVPQVLTGFDWMTVAAMLEYAGAFYNVWDKEKVRFLLQEWELDPGARIRELSSGEKQKLSIIQALGHEPDLFILDEPVAALDPSARRKFIRQMIDLNMNENRTMLFSTHIASDLERVAADVAILKDGVIACRSDLSGLQERIRRLHIRAEYDLPQRLSIPGMIYSAVNGNSATVTVDGLSDEAIYTLGNDLGARITTEPLNLEDIFLEVTR